MVQTRVLWVKCAGLLEAQLFRCKVKIISKCSVCFLSHASEYIVNYTQNIDEVELRTCKSTICLLNSYH